LIAHPGRQSGYVGGVTRNSAGNLVKWIMDLREAKARDIAAYLYKQ
jgi:hypothetical protein